MQCEFSHAELVLLDLAVMQRLGYIKSIAPPESEASDDDKLLWQHIRKLEALHEKLNELIEKASAGAGR